MQAEYEIENPKLAYLERRLNAWADYFIRGSYTGIGYASTSPIARLISHGAILLHSEVGRTPEMNEEAEEIENLVKRLSKTQKKWADCLRDKYFCRVIDYPLSGKRRNVAAQLAKKRGVSDTTFWRYIQFAKMWLIQQLDEIKAVKRIDKNIYLKRAAND
jgi:hypothetical protein